MLNFCEIRYDADVAADERGETPYGQATVLVAGEPVATCVSWDGEVVWYAKRDVRGAAEIGEDDAYERLMDAAVVAFGDVVALPTRALGTVTGMRFDAMRKCEDVRRGRAA